MLEAPHPIHKDQADAAAAGYRMRSLKHARRSHQVWARQKRRPRPVGPDARSTGVAVRSVVNWKDSWLRDGLFQEPPVRVGPDTRAGAE